MNVLGSAFLRLRLLSVPMYDHPDLSDLQKLFSICQQLGIDMVGKPTAALQIECWQTIAINNQKLLQGAIESNQKMMQLIQDYKETLRNRDADFAQYVAELLLKLQQPTSN